MKFFEVFKETLFEEKKEKDVNKNKKYVKGLKLFYIVDVKISEPEEQPIQEPETQVQAPPPAPEQPVAAPVVPAAPQLQAQVQPTESFYEKVNTLLEEENIENKIEGVLTISENEVDNIQTLEDLLDYLSDKKDEKGKQIIDDFIIETIYTITGINTAAPLNELLKKEDRILIDLDYGTSKKDSVGIKILKRNGVNNISIMLKKNGNIIPAKFNLQDFNNQLIIFRNSIFGETK